MTILDYGYSIVCRREEPVETFDRFVVGCELPTAKAVGFASVVLDPTSSPSNVWEPAVPATPVTDFGVLS